mmetsp:Transcript_29529/g.80780  ORF Transcript_29529/g.80780 Transcript_29529/m.80780 type:complete len:545 (+) Transcript_29529:94-1728(+)
MPITQRMRSFQLFQKLGYSRTIGPMGMDESHLDIDKMMIHCLDCLAALQCVMGQYDPTRAEVYWGAIATIAEIGTDAALGHVDRRHPGASLLLRAFPMAGEMRSWLPLHWAAVTDNIDPANIMKIAKADPLATTQGNNTRMAANPGHLISAVRNPNIDAVRCLFNFYPRMASSKDAAGDTPIHYAARYTESVEMIKFLLQMSPESTKVQGDQNLVPLQCAVFNESPNRLDIVQALLEVDPSAAKTTNVEGDTALHKTLEGDCDVLLTQLLLKIYPDSLKIQNDLGHLPLHTVCYSNKKPTTIRILLQNYPQAVRVESSSGQLPIHIAAEMSSAEMFDELVKVDPETVYVPCTEDSNNTPLIKASAAGNEEICRYICTNFPAAVKFRNAHGLNAMHFAVERDTASLAMLLHETDPELIRATDDGGRLPLHVFAQVHHDTALEDEKGEMELLRFLLNTYPKAVSATDNAGYTPFSLSNHENPIVKRMFLLTDPSLMPDQYRELNYLARRMGLFLAFAAINADGIPNIFSKLRQANMSLLRHSLSFL